MLLRKLGDDGYEILETLYHALSTVQKEQISLEKLQIAIKDESLDGIHSGELFLTTNNAIKAYLNSI